MKTWICDKCGVSKDKEREIRQIKVDDSLGLGPRFELCLSCTELLRRWVNNG